MITWEYVRIQDKTKDPEVDSLEKIINEHYAPFGWRIIQISDGYQYRTATLEREINGTSSKSINHGTISVTREGTPQGNKGNKRGPGKSRTQGDTAE